MPPRKTVVYSAPNPPRPPVQNTQPACRVPNSQSSTPPPRPQMRTSTYLSESLGEF